jgi:hypothetical protein
MRPSTAVIILVLGGCAACASRYIVVLQPNAAGVALYELGASVPESCESRDVIEVTDGVVPEGNSYVHAGSYEDALIRLRNKAAEVGADGVVVIGREDHVIVDGEGYAVTLKGRALRCAKVRPNSALSPSHPAVTARAYCGTRRAVERAG